MKAIIFAVAFVILLSGYAGAADAKFPLPDVSEWRLNQRTDLTIKASVSGDTYTIYLGFIDYYTNPANDMERVVVVKRFIAIAEQSQDKKINEHLALPGIIDKYRKKLYQDELKNLYVKSDPIIYMRYSLVHDAWTGEDVISKPVDSWLFNQQEWVFNSGQLVKKEVFSEPSIANLKKDILVGIKYSIGEDYNILKFDQNLINTPKKEKK